MGKFPTMFLVLGGVLLGSHAQYNAISFSAGFSDDMVIKEDLVISPLSNTPCPLISQIVAMIINIMTPET